jgi:hypothetical protein
LLDIFHHSLSGIRYRGKFLENFKEKQYFKKTAEQPRTMKRKKILCSLQKEVHDWRCDGKHRLKIVVMS